MVPTGSMALRQYVLFQNKNLPMPLSKGSENDISNRKIVQPQNRKINEKTFILNPQRIHGEHHGKRTVC